MTASTLTRAALALLLVAGLAGCSNVVDPSTGQLQGQKTPPAAEKEPAPAAADAAMAPAAAAELDRLKRENQTLKVQQVETQARVDTLTKQMGQEREEQRRFREMMATNFDLLEQSVAKSLTDNMDRGARKPGQEGKTDNKTDNKTPMAGPAMTPPPAGTEARPAAEAAPSQPAAGPAALQPLPYWDDSAPAKEPAGATPASKFEPSRPEPPRGTAATGQAAAASKPTGGDSAKSASAAATGAAATASQPAAQSESQPPLPGMGGAEKQARQAPAAPVPVVLSAPAGKPAAFRDPDLEPPANPRPLKPHPEAKPLYEKGFVHFAKGDYEESIRVYRDFLARFPDDIHSDNAQFWIGEAHLQLKQVDQADAAYRAVLRNYAHKSTLEGYKTPDAIYKLGQMALIRNDPGRAEHYFRNVSERFPESTAGQKSQRELDAIRVNTAAGQSEASSPDS